MMNFEEARARLVKDLGLEVRDKRVLEAMAAVPREQFVPPEYREVAYEDRPLPIGFGQTISQPLIIAMMTEALELTGSERVLEVGTGSGYQAGILAKLAGFVVTTERIPELARKARDLLLKLGYHNVEVQVSGERLGWPSEAPYDAIIVTAAAPKVPPELLAQLKTGGRMVIPIGSLYLQELYKLTKGSKRNTVRNLGGCRFVPLIAKGAWEKE